MVELVYKILSLLISPIIWFWNNIPKYVKKKHYAKVVISFLISLLLMAMIAFDLLALAYIIIMFANNHLGLVCLISGIGILFWQVKAKTSNTAQEQTVAEDKAYEELKAYARNGYRDMRLIVYKTLQTISEAIGIKKPRLLNEIESVEKYYINQGCAFFQFNALKEDINRKFSDDELEDARKVLEDTFLELWHKGEFPSIEMRTYTDNNGVILPPVSFILVSDMGRTLEIFVAFTTPATVDFLKRTRQESNATTNGYDKDDSRLL